MIILERLYKRFGYVVAVGGVDLRVKQGEVVVIVGPSGSGKSTVLRCINLLEQPTEGDVWVDGIHVQARLEDDAQCLLVIIGATPEGKKELVGLIDGVRESAQSWKELLLELKRRGLAMGPELAVADGALGFWKAIEEVFPGTRHQRCWVHKTANVLNKVTLSVQVNMKG